MVDERYSDTIVAANMITPARLNLLPCRIAEPRRNEIPPMMATSPTPELMLLAISSLRDCRRSSATSVFFISVDATAPTNPHPGRSLPSASLPLASFEAPLSCLRPDPRHRGFVGERPLLLRALHEHRDRRPNALLNENHENLFLIAKKDRATAARRSHGAHLHF